MTWTLRRPKKQRPSSARSGSGGGKESSELSQAIMHSLTSNETPSSQSSPDQMTGLSALTLLCLKDLYTPFTQSELEFYRKTIKSRQDLANEIQQVRSFMIETEKCYANGAFSKEEYALSVTKLTQLFKTLLYKKDFGSPYLKSTTAPGLPTHLTL
jgi:hypothetical protein